MKEPLKEVTVYTFGDSGKISTWSNIPYFFTNELIRKGIKVNRVDIGPFPYLERFYNETFLKFLRIFNPDTTYEYLRTFLNYLTVRYRIKKALKLYKNSELQIFLTFSFSAAGLTDNPSVLFCDWTYDYYFKYFKNREPDFLEKKCVCRENKAIEESKWIISLFPGVSEYMKKHYANKNIHYIGNVINSTETSSVEIIPGKLISNNILFIGSKKYIEGAEVLVKAFSKIKVKYPACTLHFVGLKKEDFSFLPDDVICHGFLNKDKSSERELFYSLLKKAKVFINTTPKWGAFSATIEAMYFYTPVILTAYSEFTKTFGETIDFGYYCSDNNEELLYARLEELFSNPVSYENMCLNASDAVKEFTWRNYIDKFLELEFSHRLNNGH